VRERRADQHCAGNRPKEHQRLPVAPAEKQADQAVQEERAEDPRGEVGRRKATARADREDDRDRSRRGEDERDDAVDDLEAAKISDRLAQRGRASARPLEA
jgi:hypothetical protein